MSAVSIVLIVVISIGIGFVTGSGSVYAFNHIPDSWLGLEEKERKAQRIKSVPWKYVLSVTFIIIAIHLGFSEPSKSVGIYVACVILAQIVFSSFLYSVMPVQLSRMLAFTALGILPFGGDLKQYVLGTVAGTVAGAGFMLVKSLATKERFSSQIVELSCAIGLITGWEKSIIIIVFGFALWAVSTVICRGKIKNLRIVCEGFFISLCGLVWIAVDNGVAGSVIDRFLW